MPDSTRCSDRSSGMIRLPTEFQINYRSSDWNGIRCGDEMQYFSKLKTLMELPNAERSAKIRRAVGRRTRRFLDAAMYSYIAPRLNRSTFARYSIGYKPDSHCDFGRIPNYSQLFKLWTTGNMTNNCGD